ncbi:hypothetical protein E4656_13670 [Natronospirillum operosum]|uniref:ArsR family transcriptional regulator n=1 Tax=Natronospirillum operosum TaxID=2759953 RepID=A0A4Z0WCB9_9GAMM|nr:hypothetical protein [Natronospirillum operosum]TGG92515.1 hypothetical protein E4656_13670 [Natronospirillum operosum]
MHPNQKNRHDLLVMFYDRLQAECRPGNYRAGWIAENDLRSAFAGDIDFHLVALQKLGQIERSGYQFSITGKGILAVEAEAGQ